MSEVLKAEVGFLERGVARVMGKRRRRKRLGSANDIRVLTGDGKAKALVVIEWKAAAMA